MNAKLNVSNEPLIAFLISEYPSFPSKNGTTLTCFVRYCDEKFLEKRSVVEVDDDD